MQHKSIWKMSILAAPLMLICGLLAVPAAARAQANEGKCTNGTLRGDYGFFAEGFLLGVPGLPTEALFRSGGMAHFDGQGKLTWVEHTVLNGVSLELDWTAASGTYTVNSNCTGKAVVNTPNSFVPLNLFFVVVKGGKEIRSVLDTNAVSAVFIKAE